MSNRSERRDTGQENIFAEVPPRRRRRFERGRSESRREESAFVKEGQLKEITLLATGLILTARDATQLRNTNLKLTKQVTELQGAPIKAPANARYYTVEPGDTLASIARKLCKSTARWKDLQDANYNQLQGGVSLKPGIKLIVPK